MQYSSSDETDSDIDESDVHGSDAAAKTLMDGDAQSGDTIMVHRESNDRSEGKEEEEVEEYQERHHRYKMPSYFGVRPKYKTVCVDCGSDICEGQYKCGKPELMMLGSGELRAYSVE